MNYLDIINQSSPGDGVSLFSLATTGIKKDDKIIAVFLGKLDGPIVSMANEDITHEELNSTYKYHRISTMLFDSMIKVHPSVMYNSLRNFFSNDIMVTYNPEFVRSMIRNLQPGAEVPEIVDICKICQWVKSGQIFNTPGDATLGNILLTMSDWKSAQKYGFKSVVKDLVPSYMEDISKPAPEASVEALRCLCRFLETQQVRISQAE